MSPVLWSSSHEGKLLKAVLSRPVANILDGEMILALREGLRREVQPGTSALLLAHEGPHFSFGASVSEHRKEQVAEMLRCFHDLFLELDELALPLLASVKGLCLGGGFELVSFCHFVFAHPAAKLGQPEITLGVFPPLASTILPLRLPARADYLNLTGQAMGAGEMAPFGVITELAEDPSAAAEAFFVKNLAERSAASLRHATRASRWPISRALRETLPIMESQYLTRLMASHDAYEGIEAFLAKRKPEWRNA